MTRRRIFRGQRMMLPGGLGPATVVVDDGVIVEVAPGPYHAQTGAVAPTADAESVIDFGDATVFPGLVDCHVHMNEPGRTEWEGFLSATRAAAAGGVTTLVDMPLNCIPVTTTAEALQEKLDASSGKLHVDVGFWGGVVPDNGPALHKLAAAGVLGCKAFMVDSGIDEFPKTGTAALREAMIQLKTAGIPLLAHAEIDVGAAVTVTEPSAYLGYLQSRPSLWEERAMEVLVDLCRETGCATHVVHLSSANSLQMLRAAQAEGLPLSAETCPHYLCLKAEDIPDGATEYKCAPPIRNAENQELLWTHCSTEPSPLSQPITPRAHRN